MGLFDSIASSVSNEVQSIGSTPISNVGTFLSGITNVSGPNIIDAAGNAIGNLTPAQIASGLTPSTPQPRPATPTPTSPQVAKTVSVAKTGIGALIVPAALAWFFLFRR